MSTISSVNEFWFNKGLQEIVKKLNCFHEFGIECERFRKKLCSSSYLRQDREFLDCETLIYPDDIVKIKFGI